MDGRDQKVDQAGEGDQKHDQESPDDMELDHKRHRDHGLRVGGEGEDRAQVRR